MQRLQTNKILSDLGEKMVSLTSPRHVGKSWLAKTRTPHYRSPVHLNGDRASGQTITNEMLWPPGADLLILDELHKMPNRKNHLKGLYDTTKANLHLLVTGSARLGTFRQDGDRLAGRFFTHGVLPFSPAEPLRLSAIAVTLCLLKQYRYLEDQDGIRRDLRNLRKKEGKEVDFLVHTEGVQLVATAVPAYDQDGLSVRALLPWLESLSC